MEWKAIVALIRLKLYPTEIENNDKKKTFSPHSLTVEVFKAIRQSSSDAQVHKFQVSLLHTLEHPSVMSPYCPS